MVGACNAIASARADEISTYICTGEVLRFNGHNFGDSIEKVDHLVVRLASLDGGKRVVSGLSIPTRAITHEEASRLGWSQIFFIPNSEDFLRVFFDFSGKISMSSVTLDGVTNITTHLSCRAQPMRI